MGLFGNGPVKQAKDRNDALMGYAALVIKLLRMAPQSLSNEVVKHEIIIHRYMPISRHLKMVEVLSIKFLLWQHKHLS